MRDWPEVLLGELVDVADHARGEQLLLGQDWSSRSLPVEFVPVERLDVAGG